jgi:hypothetical protein
MVVEARSSGVFVATWEAWLDHRKNKTFIVGTTTRYIDTTKVIDSFGIPYDIVSLFQQAAFIILGRWFGGNNLSRVNCAEVIAHYYGLENPHKWTAAKLHKYKDFIFRE